MNVFTPCHVPKNFAAISSDGFIGGPIPSGRWGRAKARNARKHTTSAAADNPYCQRLLR